MLRVMQRMDRLKAVCDRLGLNMDFEVVVGYRCERCDASFEDADDCEAHEADCEGDWMLKFQ
jgi:hypothetical protein